MLGYDVHPSGGRLVVNEEEAERVRAIFALFEKHRSILLTLLEIDRRGWRLKSWTRKTGQFRAGGSFDLGSLRRLLTNILYTGSIQHHGKTLPRGTHCHSRAGYVGTRAGLDRAPRVGCPREGAEQTSCLAERIALLRSVRDSDGVLVLGSGRSQVSLLCLPERAAQGLGGMSREIAPCPGHRGVGPRAD